MKISAGAGIVRSAKIEDVNQIMGIINPYRRQTLYSFSNKGYAEDELANIINLTQTNGYPYLVHDIDGEIVGVISGAPFMFELDAKYMNAPAEKMMEITIAVKTKYLNSETSKALHSAIVNFARDYGFHSIWGGVIGENKPVTLNARFLKYKYVTTIKDFRSKYGQYHDLHLYQRLV